MSRSLALRWFGIALGLVVFGFVVYRIYSQRQGLDFSLAQLSWPALAVSMVLYFAAQGLFAASWHLLLADRGESGQFGGDIARWCASTAGKYFPGKVWHAVARLGLYHGSERSRKIAPAFVRETCLSLGAATALVAAHAWLGYTATGHFALVFAIGAVALLLLSLPAIARVALALLERWTPFRLAVPDGGLGEMVLVWLMQLAAYVLFGLGLLALARGLGIDQAGLAWPAIAGLCFAGLAGIAAFFVPAGIGVREAALAWYLAPVIGPAPAALLAVASRLWISTGEAVLVGGGLLALRRRGDGVATQP